MSVILKAESFNVDEDNALNMRGLQTDTYNEIKGGHKVLMDPVQQSLTGTLATGASIPNLIYSKPAATVGNTVAFEPLQNAKGFPFGSNNVTNFEYINLQTAFNLLTLGDEPSAVISCWLTHRNLLLTLQGIVGHTHQSTIYSQWYLSTGTSANTVRFGANGSNYQVSAAEDTPTLYSFYFERTGPDAFKVTFAVNDSQVSSITDDYPFNNPTTGDPVNAIVPRMGGISGFSYGWEGVVHRIQCFKVDPTTFSFQDWLDIEFANNTGRFNLP